MQEETRPENGDHIANLAALLETAAARAPQQQAVVFPHARDSQGRVSYTHLTFAQLQRDIEQFAHGYRAIGITPGMRVILMVRPSLEFLPLTFALFRLGAVPILIDPGMGRDKLLHCIKSVNPQAFIGIPLAHVARLIYRKYFRNIHIFVTIGKRYCWGGHDLADLRRTPTDQPLPPIATKPEETAAVIFTTGSTGPPKGVVYTHRMFVTQAHLLRDTFSLTTADVDMPGFALFALFTLPLGIKVVIPDMDPTRPAEVDPTKIIEAIDNHGVTFSFGSPALWNKVSLYCIERQVQLQSLRQVIMAGAPIPGYLHKRLLHTILKPQAEIHTPYGATECLPVTSFQGSKVLGETLALTNQGHGVCVGNPLPNIDLRVIRISDDPITSWQDTHEMPPGEIGEIVVRGPVVSRLYFDLPEQTALHKIYDTQDTTTGTFWHRIGDVGYLDDHNRLWFCGRRAHRVERRSDDRVWYTVRCEAILNQHPKAYRSALVGLGADRYEQQPAIIVEPEKGAYPNDPDAQKAFVDELKALAKANPLTADIEHIFLHQSLPVDIRHNAKIFREKLAPYAQSCIAQGGYAV